MSKLNEVYKVISTNGTFSYCPFCDLIGDDSSEMIDHITAIHDKSCKLYIVKSLDEDDYVLHLAKFNS